LGLFHDDWHLKKFNLLYIPHSLDADQKRPRVELSRELLQVPGQDQQYEFDHILTGNESCFFEYLYHLCWAANPDDVPEIAKQKIQSEQCVISIMWGSTVIKNLLHVSKGMKYSTIFFV
jgi:hypothetical protein